MAIRKNMKGNLLLSPSGNLLIRNETCLESEIAIKIYTQNFLHHWCVECMVSDPDRGFRHVPSDTTKVSYAASLILMPGEFDVLIRWAAGHSPYPEIELMSLSVYGVYIPPVPIPKAPDGWHKAAHVKITEDYRIEVNGRSVN